MKEFFKANKISFRKRSQYAIYVILFLLLALLTPITTSSAQAFDENIPLMPQAGYKAFAAFDSSIARGDIVYAVILADSADRLYENYWGSNDLKVALVHEEISIAFSEIYQLNESIEYAEKAIAIYKQHLPISLFRITSLYIALGNIARYTSLNNKALAYFNNALEMLQSTDSPEAKEQRLLLYIETGKLHYEIGNFTEAISNYEKARVLLTKETGSDKNHNIAAIYTQVGYAYAETDSLEKALSYLHRGSGVLSKIFGIQTEEHIPIYKSIATIHFKNRQLDSTMVYAQKVLALYNEQGNVQSKEIRDFKQFLARIYFWAEAYETSAYWHRDYLADIAKSGIKDKDLAHLYLQTAGSFLSKMSMHHALEFYEKGLDLYENAPDADPLTLASLFTSISNIYQKMSYTDNAIALQIKAVELYSLSDSIENEVKMDAYINTADLLAQHGQLEEGINWLEKALALSPKVNNLQATIWNKLAQAHYKAEDFEQALAYAQKEHDFYMEIYEGIHINTAYSFLLLGNIYTRIEQQERAYEAYLQALQYNAGIFDQASYLALDANRFLSYFYRIKGNHAKADQHALLAMRIQKGIKLK